GPSSDTVPLPDREVASEKESTMKIGVIGAGNVGGTLGRRWAQKGHQVTFGVRHPDDEKVKALLASAGSNARAGGVQEAAAASEVVVLTVPWAAAQDAVRGAGDLAGGPEEGHGAGTYHLRGRAGC